VNGEAGRHALPVTRLHVDDADQAQRSSERRVPPISARSPRSTLATWARRVLLTIGVVVPLMAALIGVEWVITPSVADAQQRVHAFAVSHHSADLDEPVPAKYAAALVATEDGRFYSHPGIDVPGVARRAVGVFRQGGGQGGSTLDQQLAGMLYGGNREVRNDIAAQAVLGVKLDATYSKAQILQMYAQMLYFGQGFYGLHDASCGYFNTPPRNLTWSQASLLVALPEAPSNYDLDTDPQVAAQLQAHVLNRLVAAGALARAEADQITPNSWQLATRATTGTSSGC